ncbi:MAG TPA: TonB-dependent receptor, partial [Acidobacteriaceae bacterium]|nr:TonB-dependent receptor [Acidobacteriaceae bacterium]
SHWVTGGNAPGITSGNSLAELLLGYPNSGSLKIQSSPFFSQHYYGIWAQDDWKVTPKLTLNLGVRYDLLEARTERHNQLNYGFDTTHVNPLDAQLTTRVNLNGPLLGGTLFAGVNGNPRGAYATNLLNIQPRFGAAYAFSSRTSLRAGFGEEFISDETTDHTNGFSQVTNFNPSLDNNVTPALNNPCSVVQPNGCTAACAPGAIGCSTPIVPGNTLADPYAIILQPTATGTGFKTPQTNLGLATTPGSSINFTNPNFQVPSIWQFSVSLEQLLTKHDVLDISYSGNKSYNIEGSDDLNHPSAASYARCDPEQGGYYLNCNGNGTSGVGTTAVGQNPFQGVAGFAGSGGYYTNATLPLYNFSRPFPEFTSVTEDHLPLIHTWYNSLQVTLGHNVSRDLSLHLAYTWSKTMTAGNVIDTVYRVYARQRGSNDIPNAITFSSVYYLPIGRGKTFLGHTNRLVDAVVGGWEVSPLYVYTQWYPWFPGSNFEIMSPIAVKIHDLPVDAKHSYKRLQGVTPCVAYKDINGNTINGPAYIAAGCTTPALIRNPGGQSIQHNINFTGVREPANHQFDVSVSKRFAWSERANLDLRLDAFNVLNHPNWTYGDSYSNDPTSDNFGTIQKGPQSPFGSLPRDLQISGKFTF